MAVIKIAEKNDLSIILDLQKLCYQKEAARYNDFSIPPLTQSLEEIQGEYESVIFLKLQEGNRIIGSVKGSFEKSTGLIGRLMVHPDFQGLGYGKALVKALEKELLEKTELKRFELFTGEKSLDNIGLYQTLGYTIFKTEPFDDEKNIVFLEKGIY